MGIHFIADDLEVDWEQVMFYELVDYLSKVARFQKLYGTEGHDA